LAYSFLLFEEARVLKKAGIVLAVFVSLHAALSAEEDGQRIGRFFTGGGTTFAPVSRGGGHGEFSFLIYHNNFDMRNHIVLRGAGLKDGADTFGLLTLSEKLSMGGVTLNGRFRVYGFVEGGAGVYAGKGKRLFELPLAYTFGIGGGTDIFYTLGGSIYVETGYLGYMLGSAHIGGPVFQIGWRGYF
jgi:hypothetical protein